MTSPPPETIAVLDSEDEGAGRDVHREGDNGITGAGVQSVAARTAHILAGDVAHPAGAGSCRRREPRRNGVADRNGSCGRRAAYVRDRQAVGCPNLPLNEAAGMHLGDGQIRCARIGPGRRIRDRVATGIDITRLRPT